MRHRGVRATTVGFVVAVTLLIATGMWNYSSMTRLLEAGKSVEHSDVVLRTGADFFIALLDAEDGCRRFLASADASALAQYRDAIGAANEKIHGLLALTADNPRQQQRLHVLETTVAAIMSGFEESIARRNSGETESPRQAELRVAGRDLTVRARALLREFEDAETALLRRRRSDAATSVWHTRLIRVIAATISFTIIFWAFFLLRGEIGERHQAEQRLQEANRSLDSVIANIGRLNGELAQRASQLEAANQELEAFSYSVSHDLRAPLRHMDGFVTLLRQKEEGRLDAGSVRYLNIIGDAAGKMGRLIDDLLAFSRTGRADLQLQSVALGDLVEQARQELAQATQSRNIIWQIRPLPPVEGDTSLLRQVIVNLLSNAVKYTAPRPEAHIEVGAAPQQDGEVVIFVRDNGVGFDPQYTHKLFGVFQRLHRDEEFEGTGIGLATVRRIIQRHGGRVWAESELGHGATVWFSLRPA